MSDEQLDIPTVDEEQDGEPSAKGGKGRKPSAKQLLLELASLKYAFGVDESGRVYGKDQNSPIIMDLSKTIKILSADLYDETGMVVSNTARSEVKSIIEGKVVRADPDPVAMRCGRDSSGDILIDLGDHTERYIRVNASGWSIEGGEGQDLKTDVLFRRNIGQSLPIPKRCPRGQEEKRLSQMQKLINIDQDNWDLLVGWMIAAFVPDIPHPVLYIRGTQGSAKSDGMKMVAQMIDPTQAPKRSMPRDERHWQQLAKSSMVVPLDNVSHIQPWQSDKLCTVATGSGDVERMLFTDDDAMVNSMRRVVIFNGIGVTGIRGDLADRLLTVSLEPITAKGRKTEKEVDEAYNAMKGSVLGALLNRLSQAMSLMDNGTAHLSERPRMADFAEWLNAVDIVRKTKSLALFESESKELSVDIAENDKIIDHLRTYLEVHAQEGSARFTSGEWIKVLATMPTNALPEKVCSRAESFSSAMLRCQPGLREAKWTVEFKKSNGKKTWEITLPPLVEGEAAPVPETNKVIKMSGRRRRVVKKEA
jgi:hypothetical protein